MKRPSLMQCAAFGWLMPFALYGYWACFDNPVVYSDVASVVINPADIHPGGFLVLHETYRSNFPVVPNTAVRTLVEVGDGHRIYILSAGTSTTGAGKMDQERAIKIPSDLPLGDYTYNFQALHQINPVKQRFGGIEPIPFTVTPPKPVPPNK